MEKQLIEILKNNVEDLEGVEITPDTELISGGYIESFDIIQLISEIEEAFHVEISFDEIKLENFNTVASICKVIESFQGA